MIKKLNFQDVNDLNISNSTDKVLNDILTEDLLSYSEDISKSIANQHPNLEKNKIANNKNIQLKSSNIQKNENNTHSNNSEITISFLSSKNKSESQNCTKIIKNEGKENNNVNNDINNNSNGSNKELSVLQISLSNLLSDIDSKDLLINQINKSKEKIYFENKNKKDQKNFISNQKKQIIKLQNEKDKLTYDNKNIASNDNNKKNNNINENIYVNNINNNIINVGNNFIINSNLYNQDKLNSRNSLKYAKNKYIYDENKIKEKINNNVSNKNIKNKYNINNSNENNIHNNIHNSINNSNNNENVKTFTPSKFYYQIEKGENFQLSMDINAHTNHNLIYNNINNYKIQSILTINKTQNFTIDSICFEYNNCNKSEFYDLNKKNNITMSMKIIKEILKNNKINTQISNHINNKNKMKLINNKNLVILKDESKKFFYNPKVKYNTNEIFYPSKNDCCNKTKYKLNINNNSKSKIPSSERNIKNDKKIILRNFNQARKNKNKNIMINNINPKNSHSFQKSILSKGNSGYKINISKEKRNTISEYNSYNNSSNKKRKNSKLKESTNSKINNSINNKKISIKTTIKNKNENDSEPLIKYYSNTNSKANHLINQIKLAQKKTTNKLLTKLTNLNYINKRTLFPLFSKIFLLTSNKKNAKEDISNINPNKDNKNNTTYKSVKICKFDKNKNIGIKLNKNKCLTDDISVNKEIKNKNDKINYKKINRHTNLASLINNFNKRDEGINKNNKSLINIGGLYFINQSQAMKRGDTTLLSSNLKERTKSTNRGKLILSNDYNDKSNFSTLNYSLVKNRPQIINDFSNYKKKGDCTCKFHDKISEINIEKNNNFKTKFRRQRIETDINNSNYNNKNHINMKKKKRNSFKKK